MYCLANASPDGDLNTSKLLGNKTIPKTVLEYIKRVQAIVWNRRFFSCHSPSGVTNTVCGLGAKDIKEGDWCCILVGCSVPVVLRAIEGGLYEFLGECYLDGMMDGEAAAIIKNKAINSTQFNIR